MKIVRPKSKQPLPKDSKIVFSGVIFDVYQWKQKMYDGNYKTFEKIKRPDTVVIFPVLPNGDIILTKQEQPGKEPFIGAAGGQVDKGEKIIDAAKRELLEETGYKAEELILWKSLQPLSKIEWAIYIFVAKGLEKVADLNPDSGEKIELLEVGFDDFLRISQNENFYEPEIYRDVIEATIDKEKMKKFKELLSP